jgi:hypothetical protein
MKHRVSYNPDFHLAPPGDPLFRPWILTGAGTHDETLIYWTWDKAMADALKSDAELDVEIAKSWEDMGGW